MRGLTNFTLLASVVAVVSDLNDVESHLKSLFKRLCLSEDTNGVQVISEVLSEGEGIIYTGVNHQGSRFDFTHNGVDLTFRRAVWCDDSLDDEGCLLHTMCPMSVTKSGIYLEESRIAEIIDKRNNFKVTREMLYAEAVRKLADKVLIAQSESEESLEPSISNSAHAEEEVSFDDLALEQFSLIDEHFDDEEVSSDSSILRSRRLRAVRRLNDILEDRLSSIPSSTLRAVRLGDNNVQDMTIDNIVSGIANVGKTALTRPQILALGKLPPKFNSKESFPKCFSEDSVLDQGSCGSCWAYAAAAEMTISACVKNNKSFPFVSSQSKFLHSFNPKRLMDCWNTNQCNGGMLDAFNPAHPYLELNVDYPDNRRKGMQFYTSDAFRRFRDVDGYCALKRNFHPSYVPPECLNPFYGQTETCKAVPVERRSGIVRSVVQVDSSSTFLRKSEVISLLKAVITRRGAARLTISAPTVFQDTMEDNLMKYSNPDSLNAFALPKDVTLTKLRSGNHSRHAVIAVGYEEVVSQNKVETFLILQNSWGPSFGARGYYKVSTDSLLFTSLQDGFSFATSDVDVLNSRSAPVPPSTISIADDRFRGLKIDTNKIYLHKDSIRNKRPVGVHFRFDESVSRVDSVLSMSSQQHLTSYPVSLEGFEYQKSFVATFPKNSSSPDEKLPGPRRPFTYTNKLGVQLVDWFSIPVLTRSELNSLVDGIIRYYRTLDLIRYKSLLVLDSGVLFDRQMLCSERSFLFDPSATQKSLTRQLANRVCAQLENIEQEASLPEDRNNNNNPPVPENPLPQPTPEPIVPTPPLPRVISTDKTFVSQVKIEPKSFFFSVPDQDLSYYAFITMCTYVYVQSSVFSLPSFTAPCKIFQTDPGTLKTYRTFSDVVSNRADLPASLVESFAREAASYSSSLQALEDSILFFFADANPPADLEITVANDPKNRDQQNALPARVDVLLPTLFVGSDLHLELYGSEQVKTSEAFIQLSSICKKRTAGEDMAITYLCSHFKLNMAQKILAPTLLYITPLFYIMGQSFAITFDCNGANKGIKCTGFRFASSFSPSSVRLPRENDWDDLVNTQRAPMTLIVDPSNRVQLPVDMLVDFTVASDTEKITHTIQLKVYVPSMESFSNSDMNEISRILYVNHIKHFDLHNFCQFKFFFSENFDQNTYSPMMRNFCVLLLSYNIPFATDDTLPATQRSLYVPPPSPTPRPLPRPVVLPTKKRIVELGTVPTKGSTYKIYFPVSCSSFANDCIVTRCEVHMIDVTISRIPVGPANSFACSISTNQRSISVNAAQDRSSMSSYDIYALVLTVSSSKDRIRYQTSQHTIYQPRLEISNDARVKASIYFNNVLTRFPLTTPCTLNHASLATRGSQDTLAALCTVLGIAGPSPRDFRKKAVDVAVAPDTKRRLTLFRTHNGRLLVAVPLIVTAPRNPQRTYSVAVIPTPEDQSGILTYRSVAIRYDIPSDNLAVATYDGKEYVNLRHFVFYDVEKMFKLKDNPYVVAFSTSSSSALSTVVSEVRKEMRVFLPSSSKTYEQLIEEVENYFDERKDSRFTTSGELKNIGFAPSISRLCGEQQTPLLLNALLCEN
eukprot:GDKJ01057626.1.p1 GENE.GDKJ01057626.1~~GDKJ01057626.1.p1  ORF type:complete len:1584 (+),score=311.19 GDKJ01057626.1:6-4757(+)